MPSDLSPRRHRVIATFPDPEAARQAMLALEESGVDAHDIHLETDTTDTRHARQAADHEVSSAVVRRYGAGAFIGAAAGAVVFASLLVAIGARPLSVAIVVGVVAGGIVGFLLGGFWGVTRKLPVNVEALDTYQIEPQGDAHVDVVVDLVDDPDVTDHVVGVLRRNDASLVHSEA